MPPVLSGPGPVLSAEVHALIPSCGSIRLASRTQAFRPVVGRGLAVHAAPEIAPDQVRVCLSLEDNRPLVQAVMESGAIAVALSQPLTHRSLQIKGLDARLVPPDPVDRDAVARIGRMMALEIRGLGYGDALADLFLRPPHDSLGVLVFTAHSVFDQTPGPAAGAPFPACGPTGGTRS